MGKYQKPKKRSRERKHVYCLWSAEFERQKTVRRTIFA